METAALWVAFVAACAAIGSAVFAFVQAKAATDSRADAQSARDEAREARDESARLAGEANDAFKRQAEAQEEANRIEREKLTPPDWSDAVNARGDLYRITNTSGRELRVTKYVVKPEGADNLVRVHGPEDGVYGPGDSLQFTAIHTFGGSPEKLTIIYQRDGDGTERQEHVPL